MADLKIKTSGGGTSDEKSVSDGVAASFASLKTGLDGLILQTVLTAGSAGSGSSSKEPLSLQTTSNNFRKFVQKSGPIFAAQDSAEAVLRWDDTPRTVFFGVAWAFLCTYPVLVFILPNIILAAILLSTHHRHVQATPDDPTGADDPKPVSFAPPDEGSVDYLANLTNIQTMMGRISDGSDFIRSFAPYLSWRDHRTSLVLLQLSILTGCLSLALFPLIPFKLVFLLLGESVLLAGHPITISLAREASPLVQRKLLAVQVWAGRLLEEDAMGEDELEGEMRVVERFDVESRQDGVWGPDIELGGELPSGKGWRWVRGSDWTVDVLGDWAGGVVDAAGWTYLFIDGTRSALPVTPTGQANARRRRMTRRAVKIEQPL